jgi:hypothetical protein
MSRTLIVIATMLLCIGAPISVYAQHQGGVSAGHPTVFAPDDENRGFEDAAPPSDLVLNALLNSAEAKDTETRKALVKYDRESSRKLFQVVRVDISDTSEEDYIALGSGPMTGADNSWFWIVRTNQGKAQVLLFTNGLTVRILHRKTNGYRDMEEIWGGNAGVVTRLYRYNGSRYIQVSKRFEKAKP